MARRLLTAVNYSGGVQSTCILEMLLTGMLPRPEHLLIVNADPGAENSLSYGHVNRMRQRCREAGIDFVTASGPNLYRDIMTLKETKATRLDNPPFWTPSTKGRTEGHLVQKCTQAYKVAPMDRAVRLWIEINWGISRKNSSIARHAGVEKWIGFTQDEQDRASGLLEKKHAKYVQFAFPLIAMELTKSDVSSLFEQHHWQEPPPSLCNFCPWMGLRRLKDMHDNRPIDWRNTVAVDESIRDLSQIGTTKPCYVSKTLIPLVQLAEMNFTLPDAVQNDLHQCPSGSCFL